MAGGTISRTVHFVLHRAPLETSSTGPPTAPPAARPDAAAGRESAGLHALFAVRDEPWIGAVIPKRWARRAVTRNGIKRQVYNVCADFESRLPAAAHVVRLRMDFARSEFRSAWSAALKAAVRSELQQLFEKAARSAGPAPAAAIPAPAGTGGVR